MRQYVWINYKNLYQHKEISEGAINEVLEGLPATFIGEMNEALAKDITTRELSAAVLLMAKGKAPRHDRIPIEYFQKMWSTIGNDFHHMLSRGIEEGTLHEGLLDLFQRKGTLKTLIIGDPSHSQPTTIRFLPRLYNLGFNLSCAM